MMTISKRALPRRARPRGARVPSSLALSGMLKVFGHQGALELVAQQKFIANYDLSNVECCARRQGLVQCLEQRLRVRSRRGAVCFFEQLRVRIGVTRGVTLPRCDDVSAAERLRRKGE